MSHRLFPDSIFSNARLWAFLKHVDEAEAALCRSAGCPYCGGALHSASYPRKPHGLMPGLQSRCPAVEPLLLPLPASGDAALGTVFRPAFSRGAAVRGGRRAGGGRWRACGGDRAQVGGPIDHAQALAAVVARDVSQHPGVAYEARRAGGAARGGAGAVCAAPHPGSGAAGAAVTGPDLASAVDGLLRARRWPGTARRECF